MSFSQIADLIQLPNFNKFDREANAFENALLQLVFAVLVPISLALIAASPAVAVDLLWDNGPWVTHLGDGFEGADTSHIESTAGYTQFGFSYNDRNQGLADDFSVVDGAWDISTLTWYGYQNRAPTEPTMSALFVSVFDGPPGDGGSLLHGDSTTNRLTDAFWTGAYRVSPFNVTLNTRAVMELTVDMTWLPPLDPGDYWLVVKSPFLPGSGPYTPPVVPADVLRDNALQLFNDSWGPVDGRTVANDPAGRTIEPQDIPFKLWGTIPNLIGDFDRSGALDLADLNLLNSEIWRGTANESFDLNSDTKVDEGDLGVWVTDLKKTWFGDANLDGLFDTNDLVAVFSEGEYESDVNAEWQEGDWSGDLRFNTTDLVNAFADGGYEKGPLPSFAVPEPHSGAISYLICWGLMFLMASRRLHVQ